MSIDSVDETAGDQKRRFLFDLFSQNFQHVKRDPRVRAIPDFDEGFICPICFKVFSREALSTEHAEHLTLEDVPPKSLSGNVRTLTCKICNNSAGSELESHLRKQLAADAFFRRTPGMQVETRFKPFPSVNLAAVTQLTGDNTIEVICDPSRSDPKALERYYALEKEKGLSTITLQFQPGYRINRPQVALIRIAYLLAFCEFGYGFLMNPNLIPVRHQIQNSEEKVLPSWGLMHADFPDSMLGINVIDEPRVLRSFLVVFDLKADGSETRHGVILPGPTQPGFQVYRELATLTREQAHQQITLTVRTVPKEDYLSDPDDAFASHFYWAGNHA